MTQGVEAVCPTCDQPLVGGTCPRCSDEQVFRIVHREVVLLIVLSAIAVGIFFVTQAAAERERQLHLEAATHWYERGKQEIGAGQVERAIESFRRATLGNPESRTYALVLANALETDNRAEESRQVLLSLRESASEDPSINTQLARLAGS